MTKKADAFQFACYDALHALGKPATVQMVALKMGKPYKDSSIRRVLNTLCKQKAISKEKIRAVLHYYIFKEDSSVEAKR